jgi:hypothetical protein
VDPPEGQAEALSPSIPLLTPVLDRHGSAIFPSGMAVEEK